ncbi:hypothetical protein [Phyllobacterium sp. K27]
MRQLCVWIEEMLPEVLCSVMAVDRAGLLHPLAAPSLPEHFTAAIEGALIGPHAGSCGTAAYLGVPVAADDIEHDLKWTKYKNLALSLRLTACWSGRREAGARRYDSYSFRRSRERYVPILAAHCVG